MSPADHDIPAGQSSEHSSGLASALLEVRVLPWRPRTRAIKAKTLRDFADDLDPLGGDLEGMVITLGLWLAILIAAPLIVLLLAVGLFSVELPIVLALAVLLLVGRFAGVIPWTVVIVDRHTGAEHRESYRSIVRAVRRVRSVNAERRVVVRWAWA